MKTFETIEQATQIGNAISKKECKPISIYKDSRTHLFVIFDNELECEKYRKIINHSFSYLCCNFITPFAIGYKLFKDNSPVVDQFETRLQMESALKEKRFLGYSPRVLNNDSEIYQFLNYYQK